MATQTLEDFLAELGLTEGSMADRTPEQAGGGDSLVGQGLDMMLGIPRRAAQFVGVPTSEDELTSLVQNLAASAKDELITKNQQRLAALRELLPEMPGIPKDLDIDLINVPPLNPFGARSLLRSFDKSTGINQPQPQPQTQAGPSLSEVIQQALSEDGVITLRGDAASVGRDKSFGASVSPYEPTPQQRARERAEQRQRESQADSLERKALDIAIRAIAESGRPEETIQRLTPVIEQLRSGGPIEIPKLPSRVGKFEQIRELADAVDLPEEELDRMVREEVLNALSGERGAMSLDEAIEFLRAREEGTFFGKAKRTAKDFFNELFGGDGT